MGTEAFEKFVRGLEKEGVGINTTTTPPVPIKIVAEKSRLKYDILLPATEFRYSRNYKRISEIDIGTIPSLFSSKKLAEDRRIELRMSFPVTETEVHSTFVTPSANLDGRELISYIAREVMKKARLTCDFSAVYPIAESYILQRCFERTIKDIENNHLKLHLSDFSIQQAIIDLLAQKLGELTAEPKAVVFEQYRIKLSEVEPFLWRRKRARCNKTVFNFVALFNNFEEEFALFLDRCVDIESFSALASIFKIDYLGSNGAIRLYFPDFVAVENIKGKKTYWIIETKGREYLDVHKKDEAIEKWCSDVTKVTKENWRYLKVPQYRYDMVKRKCIEFSDLLRELPEH
jgi:type III restriction enzyme